MKHIIKIFLIIFLLFFPVFEVNAHGSYTTKDGIRVHEQTSPFTFQYHKTFNSPDIICQPTGKKDSENGVVYEFKNVQNGNVITLKFRKDDSGGISGLNVYYGRSKMYKSGKKRQTSRCMKYTYKSRSRKVYVFIDTDRWGIF